MATAVRTTVQQLLYGAWYQGANTTMTITGGYVTSTAVGANNPRVSRPVTGLTPGTQYNVTLDVVSGNEAGNMYARISADAELTLGDYAEFIMAQSQLVPLTFTAPSSGEVHIGLVSTCDGGGQFSQIGENFVVEPA